MGDHFQEVSLQGTGWRKCEFDRTERTPVPVISGFFELEILRSATLPGPEVKRLDDITNQRMTQRSMVDLCHGQYSNAIMSLYIDWLKYNLDVCPVPYLASILSNLCSRLNLLIYLESLVPFFKHERWANRTRTMARQCLSRQSLKSFQKEKVIVKRRKCRYHPDMYVKKTKILAFWLPF